MRAGACGANGVPRNGRRPGADRQEHSRRKRRSTSNGDWETPSQVSPRSAGSSIIGRALSPSTQPVVVSVIIPVYRGEKLIERTLDSLAAQTFADFEVLCVDDHSPDGSATIIKKRSAKDPRIRYLQTPVNQGTVPKVINCIRDEVRGRYFVY